MKSAGSYVAKLVTLTVMGAALAAASGCTAVAPYERGKLAHPTMAAAEPAAWAPTTWRHLRGATGGSAGSAALRSTEAPRASVTDESTCRAPRDANTLVRARPRARAPD